VPPSKQSCKQWCRNEFECGGWGAPVWSESRGQFFGRDPPLFGNTSTISRFNGERFRDGLVSFLFVVLLTVPPMPSHL